MIMDVGRSCFEKWFQFFEPMQPVPPPARVNNAFGLGTARSLTRVRWYVAPEGAKVFPVPHCWGSSAFYDDSEKAQWEIGEYPYEQAWSNGATPIGTLGDHYCGKESEFTGPIPWPNSYGVMQRGTNGLPACCGQNTLNAFALTNPVVESVCDCCDGITPDTVTVRFDAPGYDFDGLIIVVPRFVVPCQWVETVVVGPDREVNIELGFTPSPECNFEIGWNYADQSGQYTYFSGLSTSVPSFACAGFHFTAITPILDHFGNPTGDYATITKIA